MLGRHRTERRKVPHHALVLEHSFLFRIPPRFAWPIIIVLLCVIALAEAAFPDEIWFGPANLAVIVLAAWALNSRTAIAIGLLIMAIKLATGTMPFYPAGSGLALGNIAVRVASISIVVGLIGLARKSCEREWRSARTDQLTGALNRQAFFELIESGQCSDGWSAMIYADLDGLKKLNDEHGHAQGDESLKVFAETVRNTIRKGDVFARMGGDEFVIFMKLRDEDAGFVVARRLHEAINIDASGSVCRLKCSMGVLVLPNGSKSIDDELTSADELMYVAKQSQSGVAVSTAVEINGKTVLSPSISAFVATDRDRVTRQGDRTLATADSPEQAPPKPKSRAAA